MSGLPAVLDVIVGLAFIFLLLSLICSATVEYVEMWLRRRGILLRQGIVELLSISREETLDQLSIGLAGMIKSWIRRVRVRWFGSSEAQGSSEPSFVEKLYRNPLIFALYQGQLDFSGQFLGGNFPSYIPSKTFVLAFIDQLVKEQNIDNRLKVIDQLQDLTPDEKAFIRTEVKAKVSSQTAIEISEAFRLATDMPLAIPEDLRKTLQDNLAKVTELQAPHSVEGLVELIENSSVIDYGVKGSLKMLLSPIAGDFAAALQTLESWYSSSTERISGWYRKHTQTVSLLIATVLVVTLNVDTVDITQALLINDQLRAAVVEASKGSLAGPAGEEGGKAPDAGPVDGKEAAGKGNDAAGSADADKEAVNKAAVSSLKTTLMGLGLPIGWHEEADSQGKASPGARGQAEGEPKEVEAFDASDPFDQASRLFARIHKHWPEHIGGWIISIIAISFGSPFWFDTLNKPIKFRTAVKPEGGDGAKG
jgi:hypothetical protein